MKISTLCKTSLIAFTLGSTLAAPLAFAHKDHHDGLKSLYRQLDLTEQQRLDLATVKRQGRQDAQPLRQDMQQLNAQLRSVIQATEWDQETASALVSQKIQLQSQIALLKAEHMHYVWQQLDSEQQTQLDELIGERDSEGKQQRRQSMRRFGRLDLTQQQQKQISQLLAAQQQQHQQTRQSLRAYRQQQRELVHSDQFSQQSWQLAHQAMQAEQLNMALEVAHTRHQIWNLLDQEQQQKATKMAEKRANKANQKRHQRT